MDTTNIKYTDQRLMIDHNGNFIKRDTRAELEAFIADTNNKVPSDAVITEHEGLNDDGAKFYIETKLNNPDGQYGKFLALKQDKNKEAVNGGTKGNPGSDHTNSAQLEEANWGRH